MAAAVEVPEARRRTRTLHALPEAVSEARRWVTSVAGDLLEVEQAANLRLVISEVVTNALRHGAPGKHIVLAVTPKPQFLCRSPTTARASHRARARSRRRRRADTGSTSSSSSRAAGA